MIHTMQPPGIFEYDSKHYFYVIDDYSICCVYTGKLTILDAPNRRETFIRGTSWNEVMAISKMALEHPMNQPHELRTLLRYLYASPIAKQLTLPPLDGPTFDVYRWCCHEWSDSEDSTSHNSAYDFDYVYLDASHTYILSVPSGFLQRVTRDDSTHEIVRKIAWRDIQPLLDRAYHQTANAFEKKMLLML